MKNLKKITKDLFNLSNRIKKIDRRYGVYFDLKRREYKIYFGTDLCFIAGKKLDKSVLDRIFKGNIRNLLEISREIEKHNENLTKKAEDLLIDKAKTQFHSMVKYAEKVGGDIDFENINQTRWF